MAWIRSLLRSGDDGVTSPMLLALVPDSPGAREALRALRAAGQDV